MIKEYYYFRRRAILNLYQTMRENVEQVNRRAETDSQIKNVLNEFDGKRVIVNIADDTIYALAISKGGLSLESSAVPTSEDMYLELDKKTAEQLINREIDPFKLLPMVLLGRIKIKNIGAKEIDILKGLFGK